MTLVARSSLSTDQISTYCTIVLFLPTYQSQSCLLRGFDWIASSSFPRLARADEALAVFVVRASDEQASIKASAPALSFNNVVVRQEVLLNERCVGWSLSAAHLYLMCISLTVTLTLTPSLHLCGNIGMLAKNSPAIGSSAATASSSTSSRRPSSPTRPLRLPEESSPFVDSWTSSRSIALTWGTVRWPRAISSTRRRGSIRLHPQAGACGSFLRRRRCAYSTLVAATRSLESPCCTMDSRTS